ncbi:MAG: LytTR family transcriptional regulator DNA-binding domain-containing protein [Melioribacteraceae bacterium]
MKYKAIIIDDEKLAREIIKKFLEQNDNLEVLEECSNGFEGVKTINELKPDLIFLDIQMPKINGFEMLELLEHKPAIIFSTAYDEYALKAFEVDAIDYLQKPYSKERFNNAVEKVIDKLRNTKNISTNYDSLITNIAKQKDFLNRIIIKTSNKIIIIPKDKITYLQAQDDYVMIHSELGKHLKQQTMKFYEQHLDDKEFYRVHRSYIVKLSAVKQIELFEKDSYKITLQDGTKIPVSRSGFGKIRELLK